METSDEGLPRPPSSTLPQIPPVPLPPAPPPLLLDGIVDPIFPPPGWTDRGLAPAAGIPSAPMAGSYPASGSGHDDSDDDDSENDDDEDDDDESDGVNRDVDRGIGGSLRRWYPIEEDKSEPCEDELAFIAGKKEHSALDHEHWESVAFSDLDDPEITVRESGRIEWMIEHFNGTKEHPNSDHLMKSPVVRIGGLYWQIKFYPKGNGSQFLSVYVECISLLSPEFPEYEELDALPFPLFAGAEILKRRKTIAAEICVVMYNPTEPRVFEFRAEAHQFHKNSADYGWKYFTQVPRDEFHIRKHTQRQAILRDDKLAFTAYIRVVDDSTGCMWRHGIPSPTETTRITGLRPFFKSFNSIAIVLPLLHFAPFRDFVRNLESHLAVTKWLKPLVLKMFTRAMSHNYGSLSISNEGDVMEMLWRISRNVRSQCDEVKAARFTELLGTIHAERGTPCSSNRLNTKQYTSVQAAVDKHDKFIACPKLLTMELLRQEHDKKSRRWLKLTNKVNVEDQIEINDIRYTLYAFITHDGALQSTRYNSYVRPNGPGKGWYSYSKGRVTRLTEKQARQIHSGPETPQSKVESTFSGRIPDFGASRESEREVTCVVMYVRHDIAEAVFNSPFYEPLAGLLEGQTDEDAGLSKTAVNETVSTPGESDRFELNPGLNLQTSLIYLADLDGQFRRTAAASTPEPVLNDGEDIVMRDSDDESTPVVRLPNNDALQVDGVGTLDWLGRPYYQGQLLGSKYQGGGHLIALNGDEYLGLFKDGLQHGYGKMIYSGTGNVYEGDWLEGEHHGHGKLTESSTGNVFEGGWKHGRKHGEFVLRGTVTEDEQTFCAICYSKEVSTAFYDCGHVVTCYDCAVQIEHCPVCRRRVAARLQLYGVKMTRA